MYFSKSTSSVLLLALTCAAWPSQNPGWGGNDSLMLKRTVTPDNTCGSTGAGAGNNYTCSSTVVGGGSCCSSSGYCGSTADYCGTGCQAEFGACDGATGTEPSSDDFNTCGPSNNNLTCANGACCSLYGYCGTTTDYCAAENCQAEYGNCTTSQGTGTTSDNGQCGPDNGKTSCPSGQCCSAAGWCGTGTEYCADPDCQYQYGTCDSDTTPAGSRTDGVERNLPGNVSYTDDIYDCVQNNFVALTYDDGPYEYTSELLDLLDQFDFKATFFITGNNLGKGPIDTTAPYPSLIQRMISSGHQVASHTWSHYSLQNISSEMRIDQMVKNEMAFVNIIGKYPTYVRPPYSQCDEASDCWTDLQNLGYHRVYFDLNTEDYLNPLPTQIQKSKNIVEQALAKTTADGYTDYLSIQHDIVQQSVTNLTSYYYGLIQAKGWKGVPVGTCLNDPEENWYRLANGTAGLQVSSNSSTSSVVSGVGATSVASSGVVSSSSSNSTTYPEQTLSSVMETSLASVRETSVASSRRISASTAAETTFAVISASHASSSSSTLATSTKTSSSASAPTSTCLYGAVSFCGTLKSFSNSGSCAIAAADCDWQMLQCPWKAGLAFPSTCSSYRKVCTDLAAYCWKCSGQTCSREDFLA